MKPQTLRLKNFGPFIDETIDFSKLTQAALFLITGKTGAGKTTIFDGMTYALLEKHLEGCGLAKRCGHYLRHQKTKRVSFFV